MVNSAIFRAYDIRGVVNETLFDDDVYRIGCAFAGLLQAAGHSQLIQARDGRLSSPHLHDVLQKALVDSGCDVIDIGTVPTPVMYFATQTMGCPNGVMLTASHNPANYNGLKIVLNKLPLLPEQIQAIYQHVMSEAFPTHQAGTVVKQDVLSTYCDTILTTVKMKKRLKVVVDCANGIASVVAPDLLRALGCDVVELFCELDGRFPNHAPDPSEVENLEDLIAAVKEHQADLGFAFDGDADRVMVIDETGKLIFPDYLSILFAQDIAQRQPNFKVLYDVKSTRYLPLMVKEWQGEPIMARTGHSFMKVKMRETDAALGAEASGHIFWNDRWYGVDDGIYTAARLLEIVSAKELSLSKLMEQFPKGAETPEFKLHIGDAEKFTFMEALTKVIHFPDAKILTLDGLRVEFSFGWGLVRLSNTSPYITFRFEADTDENLQHIMALFREQLLAFDASLQLPF